MKTQKQRDQERRREKLAAIQEQIELGTLKVRKMTTKERAKYPPRPRASGRRRR
jgi:anti-sigma28 factor (negative regulator of flagellin synthesis)